jgi:glucose-1-phosphate thymidylyltransferase
MHQVIGAVAPMIGDNPCLILPADGLLDTPATLISARPTPSDLLLLSSMAPREAKSEQVPEFTAITSGRAPDIALFGAGALLRAVTSLSGLNTADYTVLGTRMHAAGARVEFDSVTGWHRYRGERPDLLELNRIALDRVVTDYPDDVESRNQIVGRVKIDPTATIRDSWIVGPVVIGRGVTITDAYVGPYTSIGDGARIIGAEVERSIVSPGASVSHVSGRLVSSLVGKNARVSRNFEMPRGLRLWVGDGDEIALC